MSSISETTKFINNIYDNRTYYDLYGSSIILFILISIVMAVVYSYVSLLSSMNEIKKNWPLHRCTPRVIPIAGFIKKPEGASAIGFTAENFKYCLNTILLKSTISSTDPLSALLTAISEIYKNVGRITESLHDGMDILRNNISRIFGALYNRIKNLIIEVQKMNISILDSMQKLQGVMVASLYTSLGTYFTMKSVFGVILTFIIKLLYVSVLVIISLWLLPISWPAAAAASATFTAVAIPLAIVVSFMKKVMHIESKPLPKLPSAKKTGAFFNKIGKKIVAVAKDVGKGTAKAAKAVGKGTAKAAKAVGKGTAKAAKAVGKGAKRAAKKTKKAFKRAFRKPKKPKKIRIKSRCFDKNTPIKLQNNNIKSIIDVEIGDILEDGGIVTSTQILDANNLEMFTLRNIIVSGTHLLNYNDKWVYVKDISEAVHIPHSQYDEPYVYCLNTTTKIINIGELVWSDWDEIVGEDLDNILATKTNMSENVDAYTSNGAISVCADKGFVDNMFVSLADGSNVYIRDVVIGDKLFGGGSVYGIVRIPKRDNNIIVTNSTRNSDVLKTKQLYHLLTSSGTLRNDLDIMGDYNTLIENLIKKSKRRLQ